MMQIIAIQRLMLKPLENLLKEVPILSIYHNTDCRRFPLIRHGQNLNY
jgi:hypothetical protein